MSCLTRSTPIPANRGSGVEFSFNWKNPDGTNANLTGWTVDFRDESAALTSLLAVEITTAATGLITCTIDWDEALAVGVEYVFRVWLTHATALPESTNLFVVSYE
jgi:hypothetical protein